MMIMIMMMMMKITMLTASLDKTSSLYYHSRIQPIPHMEQTPVMMMMTRTTPQLFKTTNTMTTMMTMMMMKIRMVITLMMNTMITATPMTLTMMEMMMMMIPTYPPL